MTIPVPTSPPPPAHRSSSGSELGDLADEGDRPSITEVNGTVARFEMAYSAIGQNERRTFGAPLRARIPSYIFGALATAFTAVVAIAYNSSSTSRLYIWIVEGDKSRPIPAIVLAFIICLSGIATVIRSHMRGVVVTRDGLEARYLLPLGVPRVKRWAWAQIHRMVIDDRGIMLELWDSTYARLPPVGEHAKLAGVLTHAASEHGIVATHL